MTVATGLRATLCGALLMGTWVHQAGAQAAPAGQMAHELLLQFRADAPEAAQAAVLAGVQGQVIETLRPGLQRVRLPEHQPVAVVARQLMRQAPVAFAEPNLRYLPVSGPSAPGACADGAIAVLDIEPPVDDAGRADADDGDDQADTAESAGCGPAEAQALHLNLAGPEGGTLAKVVKAIDQLIELKARRQLPLVAVNAAWGSAEDSQALRQAVQRLGAAGMLLVAAGSERAALYPASLREPNVLGLAAARPHDGLAPRASSGVLARLAQQNPGWDALQLKEAVLAMTEPPPGPNDHARPVGDF